jgi:hypothetical protein
VAVVNTAAADPRPACERARRGHGRRSPVPPLRSSSGLDLSRTSGRGTNLTLVSADDDLGLNGLGGVAL